MSDEGSSVEASAPKAASDRPATELDDRIDREEIRIRYYNLMQEIRVLLPGVQILVAFLLTAPFALRFDEVDRLGRAFYGIAMAAGTIAIVCFVTPTAIHRVGRRRSRASRLIWSIRLLRTGLAFFGVALSSALAVVARMVYGDTESLIVGAVCLALVATAWVLLPWFAGRDGDLHED